MEQSPEITVICTVLNEIDSLDVLMSSLLNQTRKPDEIIVADGGSTDGTWERLGEWADIFANAGISMKALQEEGNIAEGRNLAIERASGKWIASIDGGCVAENDWLKKLAETEGDVVAGNFTPVAHGPAQKIQAVFVKRSTDRNPSSRSIMFKKSCWRKVGGYPEDLYTGEDTLFNARLEEAGCKFAKADDAVVRWRMRSGLVKWLKQFYLYGYGDGKAGINLKTRYYKKVFALLTLTYATAALSLVVPEVLAIPAVLSIVYGLFMSPTFYGLMAGIFFPLRLAAYVLGFHKGILNKVLGGD